MTPNPPPQTIIMRVCGLPVSLLAQFGNPDLFRRVRSVNEQDEALASPARQMSVVIGESLIPSTATSTKGRRAALGVRRRLFRGQVQADEVRSLASAVAVEHPDVALALDRLVAAEVDLRGAVQDLSDCVQDELARLTTLPTALLEKSAALRRVVELRQPQLAASLLTRTSPAPPSKTLRKYNEYVWKLLVRSACDTTPRDWHAHVAAIPVGPEGQEAPPVSLDRRIAWCRMENLHDAATSGAPSSAWTDDTTRLALNPLWWSDADGFHVIAISPNDFSEASLVSLRRTDLLDAVVGALSRGVKPMAEVKEAVAEQGDDAGTCRGFVQHLNSLGVLRPVQPVGRTVSGWTDPDPDAPPAWVNSSFTGSANGNQESEPSHPYLDVYRHGHPGLSVDAVEGLLDRVRRAWAFDRVLSIRPQLNTSGLSTAPRPLIDVFLDRVAANSRMSTEDQLTRQPPADPSTDAVSAARAAVFEAVYANPGSGVVDVGHVLMNRTGADRLAVDWPLDALVRVCDREAGFEGILEDVFPAGAIDARFVHELGTLGSPPSAVQVHRAFLRQVEEAASVHFVETLIPPTARGAANAVRRPVYCNYWTGDPDAASYFTEPATDLRHLPLSRVTVRLQGGQVLAEVDGRRIIPLYHATRFPVGAWMTMADLLFSATPWALRRSGATTLRTLPAASRGDGGGFRPRLTIDGLVVASAAWTIPTTSLWDPCSPLVARLRTLDRVIEGHGLPRWVTLPPERHGQRRIACDLYSLRAMDTLERKMAGGVGSLDVEELLPAPEFAGAIDPLNDGARSHATLVLRLPAHSVTTAAAGIFDG